MSFATAFLDIIEADRISASSGSKKEFRMLFQTSVLPCFCAFGISLTAKPIPEALPMHYPAFQNRIPL
jgi:hypothetical protein